MKKLHQVILVVVALATLGVSPLAAAAEPKVGDTISSVGQSFTTSEGRWSLEKDGSTKAGYAVTLNGKMVGYAVSLTVGRNGMPVAKHADGSEYRWTGSTFKREK